MEERRRYSRKDCKSQIFLTDREDLFRCIAENISYGGARIHLDDPMVEGDQLTFFIDEETPFITRGKVAWNGGHILGIELERSAPGEHRVKVKDGRKAAFSQVPPSFPR